MYMNEADRQKMQKFKRTQTALLNSEIELEQALFVYQQYIRFKQSAALLQLAEKKPRRKAAVFD